MWVSKHFVKLDNLSVLYIDHANSIKIQYVKDDWQVLGIYEFASVIMTIGTTLQYKINIKYSV